MKDLTYKNINSYYWYIVRVPLDQLGRVAFLKHYKTICKAFNTPEWKQESMKWRRKGEAVPVTAKTTWSARKAIASFFGCCRCFVGWFSPQMINSKCYLLLLVSGKCKNCQVQQTMLATNLRHSLHDTILLHYCLIS